MCVCVCFKFSIMESAISTFIDVFHELINTKKKMMLTRVLICLVYFICGLTMASQVLELMLTSGLK